jgi:hypothetical protein
VSHLVLSSNHKIEFSVLPIISDIFEIYDDNNNSTYSSSSIDNDRIV